MDSRNELSAVKWPFFLADGVLVAAAGLTLWFSSSPPAPGAVAAAVVLLIVAAAVSLVPYLIEFYWNFQQAEANVRERVESQQQAIARMGAEIAQLVSRLENLPSQTGHPEPGVAPSDDRLEEIVRAVGQWQEHLGEREGKLAVEMEQLLRDEEARREEFRRYFERALDQLTALGGIGEETTAPAAEVGVEEPGAHVEVPAAGLSVEETGEGFPADREVREEAENNGDDVAVGPELEPAPEPKPEPAQGIPNPRKRRASASKQQVKNESGASLFSTTTLVATAFIGASNKLYLRGEGPGLDWEEGVPMQFVEIGKWSWTTTEAGGPIRIQVFKNDEEADKTGILTLEPGQTLNIRPEFEAV